MKQDSEVFVGLDVAKARHAVAIAEDGRQGEIRFLGEIDADPTSVRRLISCLPPDFPAETRVVSRHNSHPSRYQRALRHSVCVRRPTLNARIKPWRVAALRGPLARVDRCDLSTATCLRTPSAQVVRICRSSVPDARQRT